MRVYHVEFAKTGLDLSGGEVWMIEVIKHLQVKGLHNILLTTDNARQAYERVGLIESETLRYKVINSYSDEQRFPIIISYLLRTVQAWRLVKQLKLTKDDVMFCHSDFFPNTVPFLKLARKNATRKLFGLFHMLAPSPFKGYEGQYTNRLQVPKLNIIHYQINQWLYYFIIRKTKAAIITNNLHYARLLQKRCPRNHTYVLKRFAGAQRHHSVAPKTYDIIWLGRFHAQKGLLEVPDILDRVKRKIPNLKVLILGDGVDELKKRFWDAITKKGLGGNVDMKGFVVGDDKYRYLSKSKVFLMTSLYESYGLVNVEAFKNGVPVVAYDLPVYSGFTEGMIKVPLLDREAMAQNVIRLLSQPDAYQEASAKAYDFGDSFSWQNTGEEVYQLVTA